LVKIIKISTRCSIFYEDRMKNPKNVFPLGIKDQTEGNLGSVRGLKNGLRGTGCVRG
jgi:hypothetical protein